MGDERGNKEKKKVERDKKKVQIRTRKERKREGTGQLVFLSWSVGWSEKVTGWFVCVLFLLCAYGWMYGSDQTRCEKGGGGASKG